MHVFAEPRTGTHMLPAKAVHEFTQTNRKSSVKSGEEGRGCGGPGEEFRIDFHSAFSCSTEIAEGGRGREGKCSLDIVVQKELLPQKPP